MPRYDIYCEQCQATSEVMTSFEGFDTCQRVGWTCPKCGTRKCEVANVGAGVKVTDVTRTIPIGRGRRLETHGRVEYERELRRRGLCNVEEGANFKNSQTHDASHHEHWEIHRTMKEVAREKGIAI